MNDGHYFLMLLCCCITIVIHCVNENTATEMEKCIYPSSIAREFLI